MRICVWRARRQALGFDVLWSAEHHFFDYSFCPDNDHRFLHLRAQA